MLNNVCVVDTTHFNIYSFSKTKEEAEQKLLHARKQQQEDVKIWQVNCEKYPDTEKFEGYLKQAQSKKYEIMGYHDFLKLEREHYINKPLQEITEEVFHEQLNVLPPIKWVTINGIEMFCMSEMYTGTYTSQYAHDKKADKYYSKMVDCMDRTTWINHFITN